MSEIAHFAVKSPKDLVSEMKKRGLKFSELHTIAANNRVWCFYQEKPAAKAAEKPAAKAEAKAADAKSEEKPAAKSAKK